MLPKIIEERKVLLDHAIYEKNLPDVDIMIMQKGVNVPIQKLNKKDVFVALTQLAKGIARDIGMKEVEVYEVGRFCDIVIRYYKRLNLQEIKLSFELLLIGELDEFLPRDKHGQPDKNHYQNFSVEYVSKVLKAYCKRKDKTWGKVHLTLPKKRETIISEKEKKDIHNDFKKEIVKAYDLYKNEGKKTPIYIPSYWVSFFNKKGLISTYADFEKNAFKEIIEQLNDRENLKIGLKLPRYIVRNRYCYDLIYKLFEDLKKKNIHIKDLI